MTENRKTVLFVDDEESVLTSLRRLLRKEDWNLLFTTSAGKALRILSEQHVDLIVADVRMPEMDGVALLSQVRDQYASIVRIILTGYIDRSTVGKALAEGCVQQVISKPWDDTELVVTIRSAMEQAEGQQQEGAGLQAIINSLDSLPTLPRIYAELREALSESADTSARQIAQILRQDPPISAKLLRWANSAVFGQTHRVDTVQRSVVVLGTEIVSGLVLSTSAFDALSPETPEIPGFRREAFWSHCAACGVIAKLLLTEIGADSADVDRAFSAGLLHDLGKLLEDRYLHEKLKEAVELARREKLDLVRAERTVLGTTHTEIGGHLAEWWNLPPFIVNAIRRHHNPLQSGQDGETVTVVHVADVLAHEFRLGESGNFSLPAMVVESASRFGLTKKRLASIRALAERGLD